MIVVKTLKIAYNLFMPVCLKTMKSRIKEELFWRKRGRFVRQAILNAYADGNNNEVTGEAKQVIEYLKSHPIKIMPYNFTNSYKPSNIAVGFDTASGFKYVLFQGKKLFLKKKWTKRKIRKYYSYLLAEQDPGSPHRYLTEIFNVKQGDLVIDAGTAEGIFALSVIDKAKRVILFEPDMEWVEALKHTFEPYKDKIEIVEKCLGKENTQTVVTIDSYCSKIPQIDFLKIDVEGHEMDVLRGAEMLLKGSQNCRIAVCTYHRQDDEIVLNDFLERARFTCNYSIGYVLFYFDLEIKWPYLRKCLIRAERQN